MPSLLYILLTTFLNTNFFFVVSTKAYLVISTSSGFNKVVATAVENTVFSIIQNMEGPAKYLMS